MKPDIILIVLDDVGIRDMNLLNVSEDMPNLANIIGSPAGIYSMNMFSMPTCSPSRRTLLRGNLYRRESGSCDTDPGMAPEPDGRCIAARLSNFGYTTAIFGKYHIGESKLGNGWHRAPYEQGFDVTDALMASNVMFCGGSNYNRWMGSYWGTPPELQTTYQPTACVDAFLNWYNSRADGPRFAVIAPQLPHAPYHLPKGLIDIPDGFYTKEEKFKFMMQALDVLIGRIMDAVSADTHVFIVADNGGRIIDDGHGKETLYDGGIRVPFFYRCGWAVPIHNYRGLMMQTDIYATILDIAAPEGRQVVDYGQGLSIFNFTFDGRVQNRSVIYSGTAAGDECVRSVHYKLIHRANGSYEFYDLRTDPDERFPINNISDPSVLTFFNFHLSQLNYFSNLVNANS